jgi:hypothetical protein
MSKRPDLKRWCPNHWLKVQLIEDDLSIWTKQTPQHDEKSNNTVQDDEEQQDAALKRRNHSNKKQLKTKSMWKIAYLK